MYLRTNVIFKYRPKKNRGAKSEASAATKIHPFLTFFT